MANAQHSIPAAQIAIGDTVAIGYEDYVVVGLRRDSTHTGLDLRPTLGGQVFYRVIGNLKSLPVYAPVTVTTES